MVSIFSLCDQVIAILTLQSNPLMTTKLSGVSPDVNISKEFFMTSVNQPISLRRSKNTNNNSDNIFSGINLSGKIKKTTPIIAKYRLPGFFNNNYNKYDNDLSNSNTYLKAINGGLIDILMLKCRIWLACPEPLSNIGHYLGYPMNIVNLINKAITHITYQKRRDKNIKPQLNDTMALYYSTCDIIHTTTVNDENPTEDLKNQFQTYIKKFEIQENLITDGTLESHVETLTENLEAIKDVYPSLNISISLMKNMLFMNKSGNDEFDNKLKNKLVGNNRTLHNLAEYYLKETDVTKIEQNHLEIIRIVATEVFSYVYDHFDILSKLSKFDIDTEDIKEIQRFSEVMLAYIDIFLTRIIDFEGDYVGDQAVEEAEEMLKQISSLVEFLNPDYESSEETPKFNIMNYFNKSERQSENLQTYMSSTIKTAVNKLLLYFNQDFDDWKDNRVLKVPNVPDDKDSLLNLMHNNTNNAIKMLKIFGINYVKEFTDKTTDSINLLNSISDSYGSR